jgi:hypothetical protein
MEIRRARWYVRKGRGQEELDTSISLAETHLDFACGGSERDTSIARNIGSVQSSIEVEACHPSGHQEELPLALEVSGRNGTHEDINGIYVLASTKAGMPVYRHGDHNLALFRITGYWVIAPEPCAVPAVLARCASSASESPVTSRSHWEFLRTQNQLGRMVTSETRFYEKDTNVHVSIVRNNFDGLGADGNGDNCQVGEVIANIDANHQTEGQTPCVKSEASSCCQNTLHWPAWVGDTSVELSGSELKVVVVAREGYTLVSKNLSLDVASKSLEVGLASEGTLSLALPAIVDTEVLPVAKVSEKTRTLKVRLMLQA